MRIIRSAAFVALLTLSAASAKAGSVVYGIDTLEDELISIDRTAGAAATIGSHVVDRNIRGLAYDSKNDTLYGTDIVTDELYTVDRISGEETPIGALGFAQISGLAYDSKNQTLYGSDTSTGELVTIDPVSGAGTLVGSLNLANAQVNGLAYDSQNDTLYGVDIIFDNLITIDRATGVGTVVGSLGFNIVSGLAYDRVSDKLFGSDRDTDSLITIDRATGAGTAVGPLGFGEVHGLAAVTHLPGSITMTPNPVGDWICLAGHCGASSSTRTVNVLLLEGDAGPAPTLEFRTRVRGGGEFANSTVSFVFDLDAPVTVATISASSGDFLSGPFAILGGGNARVEFNCRVAPCDADMLITLAARPTMGTIIDAVNQFVDSPGAPSQILPMNFELVPIPPMPLLLRRTSDNVWFTYRFNFDDLASVDFVEQGRLKLTRSSDYQTVSRSDFDGDREPDLLVRDMTGGQNGRWVLSTLVGTKITSTGFVNLTRNANWQVVSTDDFDGDDQADLLLRNNADGRWLLYLLDKQVVKSQGILAMTMDLTDTVAGTGDFNGDGRFDVLLRRADGSWLMYLLDGLSAPVEGTPAMTTNLAFAVEALARFDADDNTDVLLRRTDGRWFIYLLDGSDIKGAGQPAMSENPDWSLQAAADFNADGKADALLRRMDGVWFLYVLDGFTILGEGSLDMTKNPEFQLVTTKDYTDDGKADALLRRTDGRWILYALDGDGPAVLGKFPPDLTRNTDWIPQVD